MYVVHALFLLAITGQWKNNLKPTQHPFSYFITATMKNQVSCQQYPPLPHGDVHLVFLEILQKVF